ncbi:tetratricopeptide repeat protein [Virgibacillus necropolis]|uniref:tetratricopeptide repeat protein n=1 Tax=Virgibacillus necropolis TaxID=163877 RepID=UPI0038511F27
METIMEAVHLMENNKTKEAIELLESHVPTADEDEKFTIAELYIQWGIYPEASYILEDLLQQYPDEGELRVMLADIYIELDDDERAVNLLNEIKSDDPAYIQTLIQLADLYQAQGLFEVAEQKLLAAKQLEPEEALIDFALGELAFSTGEYQKAITYHEKVLPKTNEVANVSINDRLAEAYAASGEYELALTYFQEIESENPDTLFKYGFTAAHANRNDIAIKAWEHVIEIDPHYLSVYYELAKAYETEERTNEAYETINKGLQLDDFNKELYFYAANLAHQINKNDESEKYIREAVALDPDYKEAVLFLIEILKAQEKYDEIHELIVEIKNLGADDPLYDWELARALNEIELYKDALIQYGEAYNRLSDDSDFLKEYGYFLTEEGRTETAISIFQKYIEIQPLDTDVEEYLDRLIQSTEI